MDTWMEGWRDGGIKGWMKRWIHGWIHGGMNGGMDASSEDRPRVSHTNPPCLSVGSAPSSSPSILGIIRVWLLLEQPWDAGAPHTHPKHRSSTKPSVPNTHRNLDPVPLPPPAGRTPRCSCRDGILLRRPPGAGGTSGSPRELLIPRIPVIPGSFACRAVPRQQTLRGCQRRGCVGLMISSPRGGSRPFIPSPFILACLEPGDFS